MVLADEMVEKAVQAIVTAARTGKIGDGKIFLAPGSTTRFAFATKNEATSACRCTSRRPIRARKRDVLAIDKPVASLEVMRFTAWATNPYLRAEHCGELYSEESDQRLKEAFAATGDGSLPRSGMTRGLVESIAFQGLWQELISPEPDGPRDFALVALGGSAGWLFPHSDVDLLFLHASGDTGTDVQGFDSTFLAGTVGPAPEAQPRDAHARGMRAIRSRQRRVHDLAAGLPLSARAIAALSTPARQGDSEAGLARVAGSSCRDWRTLRARDTQVRQHRLPSRAERERWPWRSARLQRGVLAGADLGDGEAARWPEPSQPCFALSMRKHLRAALDFLMSVRCFLHFRHGRDDNLLLGRPRMRRRSRSAYGTPTE